MFKVSFSDGLAISGGVLAIILIVLDKAEKLKGPMLLVLLAVAASLTLPLALSFSWVADASPAMLKFSRGLLMFFIVGLDYSILAVWVSTGSAPGPKTTQEGDEHKDVNQKPEVALRFIYPKAPALVIVNPSDSIAKDIKWTVALWNRNLPERDDPLPIPVTAFDWIRPHDESGPQNLFGSQLVAPLLKPGDELIGSAAVLCPDCVRGRTYFVHITWGAGGWVSEVESEKSGRLLIPQNFSKETREKYFEQILQVESPEESRVPIG